MYPVMSNQVVTDKFKFAVGDLVRVHQQTTEGKKERVQFFEGRVISIRGRDLNKTFTVRKIGADNIGVEKIFPLYLPTLVKVEVKKSIPSKKAKLYHLRGQK